MRLVDCPDPSGDDRFIGPSSPALQKGVVHDSPCHITITEVVRKNGTIQRCCAARILRDRHMAEDVVQEAFFRLSQEPEPVASPGAWLRTVVRRLAVDRLRTEHARRANEQTASLLQARHASVRSPEEQVQFQELCQQVHRALAQLRESDRAVVWSRCGEGIGREELAERWGISINAVTKRETRTMRRLKKILIRNDIDPYIGTCLSLLLTSTGHQHGGAGPFTGKAMSLRSHTGDVQPDVDRGSIACVEENLADLSQKHAHPGDLGGTDHGSWRSWSWRLCAAAGFLMLLGAVTVSVYGLHRWRHPGQHWAGSAGTDEKQRPTRHQLESGKPAASDSCPPGWPNTLGWHLWDCLEISPTPWATASGSGSNPRHACAMSCLCWSRTCVLSDLVLAETAISGGRIELDARDRHPTTPRLAVWGKPLQCPARYHYTIVGDHTISTQVHGPVEISFGCVLSPTPMEPALCFQDESVREACTTKVRQSSSPVLVEMVLRQTSMGRCSVELFLDGRPSARWRPIILTANQRLFVSVAGLAIRLSEPELDHDHGHTSATMDRLEGMDERTAH